MPSVPDIEGKPAQVGRIWISGAHLAQGYLDDPGRTAEHFFTAADGTRWYRTDDYGLLSAHAPASHCLLRVLGRSDDIIITGGVKISARAVAEVLESHPPYAGGPRVRSAGCALGLRRGGRPHARAPATGAAGAPAENVELREALRGSLRRTPGCGGGAQTVEHPARLPAHQHRQAGPPRNIQYPGQGLSGGPARLVFAPRRCLTAPSRTSRCPAHRKRIKPWKEPRGHCRSMD